MSARGKYFAWLALAFLAVLLVVLGYRVLLLAQRSPLPAAAAISSRLEAGLWHALRSRQRQAQADAARAAAGRQAAAAAAQAQTAPAPEDAAAADQAPSASALARPAAAKRSKSAAAAIPRIEINRATAADFDLLPGIGPVLAGRIVEHRKTHGPFKRVEDLDQVKGIGPAKLAKIKDYCYVTSTN
jgi:competence ComEA-like helix-hairpin-helix protein